MWSIPALCLVLFCLLRISSGVVTCTSEPPNGLSETSRCSSGVAVDTGCGDVFINNAGWGLDILQYGPRDANTFIGQAATSLSSAATYLERDNAGHLFTLDVFDSALGIWRIARYGTLPTVAPTVLNTILIGACTPSTIGDQNGVVHEIAWDESNSILWVTDPVNSRVCALNPDLSPHILGATACACFTQFGLNNVQGLAVGPTGQVFVGSYNADVAPGSVASAFFVFDNSGNFVTGPHPSFPSSFVYRSRLLVTSNGIVLRAVANPAAGPGLDLYASPSPYGAETFVSSFSQSLADLALDCHGNLYVVGGCTDNLGRSVFSCTDATLAPLVGVNCPVFVAPCE